MLSGATIDLVQAWTFNDEMPRQNYNWDGRHFGDWKSHEINRSDLLPRLSLAEQDVGKDITSKGSHAQEIQGNIINIWDIIHICSQLVVNGFVLKHGTSNRMGKP